mmetsp:Transcript_24434/g.70396  ORF Transcript_24434/g.70396 Transcript_24434/m.70396 type:complete len:87 (-) Transcript_24434:101-361(-)
MVKLSSSTVLADLQSGSRKEDRRPPTTSARALHQPPLGGNKGSSEETILDVFGLIGLARQIHVHVIKKDRYEFHIHLTEFASQAAL